LESIRGSKHVATTFGSVKGVSLASVAIVVGVETNNLVPRAFQSLEVKVWDCRRWRPGLLAEFVGASFQNSNLDAFIVFNGALEQVVQVFVTVSSHAPGNTSVIAHTLGSTRQAFPTAGIVS
jgi:hypothetical protein